MVMSEYKVLLDTNINYKREEPTPYLRWLIKKDGSKELEQLWIIDRDLKTSQEWREIKEEKELEKWYIGYTHYIVVQYSHTPEILFYLLIEVL